MKKLLLALCVGLFAVNAVLSTIEDDVNWIQNIYEKFKASKRTDNKDDVNEDKKKFFHFSQTIENAKKHLEELNQNIDRNLIRYLYNKFPGNTEKLLYPETAWMGTTSQETLEANFLKKSRDPQLETHIKDAIKNLNGNKDLINIYFNLYQFYYLEDNDSNFNDFVNQDAEIAISKLQKNITHFADRIDRVIKSTQPSKEEKKEPKIEEKKEKVDEKALDNFGAGLKNISESIA